MGRAASSERRRRVSGAARGVTRRISGFTVAVVLSTAVGVAALPLLVAFLGPQTWGVLVLAQTVAQLAGIAVAFGWGATGAAMVAGAAVDERPELFRRSLRVRSVLYVIVWPLASVLMLALTQGDVVVSVLGMAVYLLPALGASWYFTGESRPGRLIVCDTIPGVSGTVAGVCAASLTGQLWAFLVCQGVGYLVAVSVGALVVLRGHARSSEAVPPWRETLREQRPAVIATGTSALYVSLPLMAVQVFMPATVPVYALADRLFRYASIAFLPVQQFFQGWVPHRDGLTERAKRAAGIGIIGGIVGGACIALLSPFASRLLSAGEIEVGFDLSMPLGVAFAGVGTSMVVGYACLVAVGRVRALALSTVIGASVGAPIIVICAAAGILPLVAWAVAVSELLVALYQLNSLRQALARSRQETIV